MPRQQVLPHAHVRLNAHDFSDTADADEFAVDHVQKPFRRPSAALPDCS